MKKESTLDYNIKASWHAIVRMYNQYGSPHGITATIGFVLLNIDNEVGTPATKIAPALGMESRSLTRMLKTLEDNKWIYRKPDAEDKRSIRIFLTEKGKHKRELSRQAVRAFNFEVAKKVSKRDMKVFYQVLNEVNTVTQKNEVFDTLAKQLNNEVTEDV